MIIGVGIDMIKIGKMKDAVQRWGAPFLERVFHPDELRKISPGKMYYQRLAARFAAKEAVIKALRKESPLALKDVCILNRANGAPYCEIGSMPAVDIALSITHIHEYAAACAIAQKKS
ncbi:MAG: 4'-phosphopantetheinyl transferase superfamily protein [Candidatus Omnitrophica bacterium]|nr:4'-phosphopantetheinyl transferase superfamily protein [Candidatus Omnitrophota bacterium]